MDTTTVLKKKKRKRLHVYPRNFLAVSGFLQVCLVQVHAEAIIRLQSGFIGFYLLAFILTTTLNIFNGFGFTKRPNITAVIITAFVTLLQVLFGSLYVYTIISETAFLTNSLTISEMGYSVVYFILGIIAAIIAFIYELIVFRNADDIYQYMM